VMYQTMLIPKPRVETNLYSKICSEDPPPSAPRSGEEGELLQCERDQREPAPTTSSAHCETECLLGIEGSCLSQHPLSLSVNISRIHKQVRARERHHSHRFPHPMS
jgi:hypothetical protein